HDPRSYIQDQLSHIVHDHFQLVLLGGIMSGRVLHFYSSPGKARAVGYPFRPLTRLRSISIQFSLFTDTFRSPRKQIRKKPIRSRYTRGQLPEETYARINEPSFPMVHRDQRAVQRFFSWIVPSDQRRVVRREFIGEIQTAFLHPALEIR